MSSSLIEHKEEEGTIAFLPKGFSSCNFSDDYKKLIFLNKNLTYLVDLDKKESFTLKNLSFVEDVCFLDNDNLLFVVKENDGISIKRYCLVNEQIETLGNLSFRYFTRLNNVRYEDEIIYFDVEYIKDGVSGSKSYTFNNNKIINSNKQDNVIKSLYVNDNFIYTTECYMTYINNSIFQYENSSAFEILGKDTEDILYLLDKTNNKIISLFVSDTIELLDSYSLEGIVYKELMCTDGMYVISEDFVYNIKDSTIIPFNTGHILLIANNTIYYEKDGEVLYKSIMGG